jgi:hypothetical protein
MAQAVSRQPLAEESGIRVQRRLYGFFYLFISTLLYDAFSETKTI